MVGVQPTVQGQGFGKDVTAAGVDHLVNTGATPISITVDSENAPAVNLYRSLGFDLATKSLWYRLNLL
jgi:mycothiol synthase